MRDKLSKINDLAFELQHDDELTAEQFWKVKHIFELSVQYQLNENQQIVLERIKELTSSFDLADAIYRFENSENWGESEEHYDLAYEALNDKERLQVIQVACQWALEQEEEWIVTV